ncbi:MAG: enoyl-CoA hydratase/isomerase family protein [Pseudomonadota bacterium]
MTYTTLTVERENKVGVITFRRPKQLNAINPVMQGEIIDAFTELHEATDVNAIVVTGEGRGFMAGADIIEYAKQTDEEFARFQDRGRRMYAVIDENDKPVIAAVNGHALGGGFELVLCCDLILAAETAKLGLPEVHLGLVPGGGGTQRAPRRLGLSRANWLLLTGDAQTAETMESWGLVNAVTSVDALHEEAMALAARVAEHPPAAIQGLKKLARTGFGTAGSLDGLNYERATVTALYQTDEARNKVQEFAEASARRAKERAEKARAAR